MTPTPTVLPRVATPFAPYTLHSMPANAYEGLQMESGHPLADYVKEQVK